MKIRIREQDVRICQLVGRYELDPFEVESGSDVLHFRYVVDIYRVLDGGIFFPRVYRYEFFRLQVSNLKETGLAESADEELLVEDTSQPWEDIQESSESDVLRCVLLKIKEVFENSV